MDACARIPGHRARPALYSSGPLHTAARMNELTGGELKSPKMEEILEAATTRGSGNFGWWYTSYGRQVQEIYAPGLMLIAHRTPLG